MYDKYNKDLSDSMVGRFTPQGSGYVEDGDTFRYSNVNSNLDGTYTITYSATNEYGANTATRSVVVRDTLAPNVFYYGDQTLTVDIADYANAAAEDLTITANTSGGGFFAELSNGALSSNNAIVVDQQLGGEGTLANPIYMDVSDWNYYGWSIPNYKLIRGKTYYMYLGSNAQQTKTFSVISTTETTNTEYDDKGSKTDYNESKLGFLWTVRDDTPSQLWLRSTFYHHMTYYRIELVIEDDDITYTVSNNIVANTEGTYTITYSATDSSNNTTTNTRTLVLTDDSAPVIPQVFYYGAETITVSASDYAAAATEKIQITTLMSGSHLYATLSNGALRYNSAMVVDSPESNVGTLQNPIRVDLSSSGTNDSATVYRGKTYFVFTGFGPLRYYSILSTTAFGNPSPYTGGGVGGTSVYPYGFLWTVVSDTPNKMYLKQGGYTTSYFTFNISDPQYAVSSSNNIVAGTPGTYNITYTGNSTSNVQTVILT